MKIKAENRQFTVGFSYANRNPEKPLSVNNPKKSTTCTIFLDSELVSVGTVRTRKTVIDGIEFDDIFDKVTGRKLALRKAIAAGVALDEERAYPIFTRDMRKKIWEGFAASLKYPFVKGMCHTKLDKVKGKGMYAI